MRTFRILGVRIVDQSVDEAVRDLKELLGRFGPRSLFFVNANTLNHAAADPAFRAVLGRATRVFGDGTGVRWAARMRGLTLRANLNGTDLVPRLLGETPGLRCFILGSAPDRIEEVLAGARRRFPAIRFVGAHHGYLDAASSERVLQAIRESGADLVLVGMGNPIQEQWIDRHGKGAPGALFVAVGGLLEYWHGSLQRASPLVQRLGMEWVHLMLRQPRKTPRYLLGNPLYLLRAARSLRSDRRLMQADGRETTRTP